MKIGQRALRFQCHGAGLVGVVDIPERPLPRGVLVVADSGQYRVGGHRQFTLLSRLLAARGIPVMRFDRRGMGDSDGELRAFDAIDDDIRAAMKEYFIQVPEMKEIVILGLGDAALAAILYAPSDDRVRALVLLNPLPAPSEGAAGRGHLYLARLGELAFWRRIAAAKAGADGDAVPREHSRHAPGGRPAPLARRIAASLAAFDGRLLLVLGEDDGPAHRFARQLVRRQAGFRCIEVAHADHAFASSASREEVATASANWIMSW